MKEKHYVIAYDVSDRKRRNRLVKVLLNYAYRVQYSVFEMMVDESTIAKILEKIRRCIDEKKDSINIYELDVPDWEKKLHFGIQTGENNIYEQECVIIG